MAITGLRVRPHVWRLVAPALIAAPLLLTVAASRTAAQQHAYVANLGANTVSVIDVASRTVIATVPAGNNPDGIAATPDGRQVYVANFLSNDVSVIDTSSNTVVATVSVGTGPVGVAITPDGGRAYVTNRGSGTVSVIRTDINQVTATVAAGPGANAVAITSDGALAYVTNSFTRRPGTVSVIDTASNTVVASIEVQQSPNRVAITPDGRTIYVTNFRSWNVSVIDRTTQRVVDFIPVFGRPSGIAVHPNGSLLYIATLGGRLEVIETATDAHTNLISVGADLYGIGITHLGDTAFVANFGAANVGAVDLVNEVTTASIDVGMRPFAVAISCTGSECDAPPYTPRPSQTPISTPTPTDTRPPTPIPSPIRTAQPTAKPTPTGIPALTLIVSTVTSRPGQTVAIGVSLSAPSTAVAGTQNDLFFDAQTPIGANGSTRPDCSVNPAIDKSGTSFGFRPPGCQPGIDCTAIRALVYALDNNVSIADGSELYRCTVAVGANATLGSHALRLDGLVGSSPDGERLNASGVDGAVFVSGSSAQLASGAAPPTTAAGCQTAPSGPGGMWCVLAASMLLILRFWKV